jgi:two-component system LytT family response regulator
MKAVIIDDESKARNLLKVILEDYCSEVVAISEAEDLTSGVQLIKNINPDVVFLDVEMPGYRGTQILDFFENDEINFQIVFTTAHSDYALKAFEVNAISYLLKPIRPKQVKETISKVSKILSAHQIKNQLIHLEESLQSGKIKKIGLPVSDGIIFLNVEDIILLKADGMYSEVITVAGEKHIISKPLKYFTDLLLDNKMFFKSHRSFVINIEHVKQIVKSDGGYILMKNDIIASATKDKLDELLELIAI